MHPKRIPANSDKFIVSTTLYIFPGFFFIQLTKRINYSLKFKDRGLKNFFQQVPFFRKNLLFFSTWNLYNAL